MKKTLLALLGLLLLAASAGCIGIEERPGEGGAPVAFSPKTQTGGDVVGSDAIPDVKKDTGADGLPGDGHPDLGGDAEAGEVADETGADMPPSDEEVSPDAETAQDVAPEVEEETGTDVPVPETGDEDVALSEVDVPPEDIVAPDEGPGQDVGPEISVETAGDVPPTDTVGPDVQEDADGGGDTSPDVETCTPGPGSPCTVAGGCAGVVLCLLGVPLCAVDDEAGAEFCDGLDNDCDGDTDENCIEEPDLDTVDGEVSGEEADVIKSEISEEDLEVEEEVTEAPEEDALLEEEITEEDAPPATDPGGETGDVAVEDEVSVPLCTPGDLVPCGSDPAKKGVCSEIYALCTGNGTPGPCAVTLPPGVELCDGLDNDCDGETDESFGVGEKCYESPNPLCEGVRQCFGGSTVCAILGVPGTPEICGDGVDDNCNGLVDEFCPGSPDCVAPILPSCVVAGQQGECSAGFQLVEYFEEGGGCQYGAVCWPSQSSLPEICDGKDNDCDGLTDEDFPLGESCKVQGCGAPGVLACNQAPAGTVCVAVPQLEVCGDGLDNDCDGVADEKECDADGDGFLFPWDCAPYNPEIFPGAVENCNGLDDNCDGKIDEGFGIGKDCYTNPTAPSCKGVVICLKGAASCAPVEGPIAEVCGDGLDNDCDGVADEGCPATCGNVLPCITSKGECGGQVTIIEGGKCTHAAWCFTDLCGP